MVYRYCDCCYHMAGSPSAAANFFRSHFIPEKWELNYFKLSECMALLWQAIAGTVTASWRK